MQLCRVMVVAEDFALRRILVDALKNWHFEVFPAADSLDALRQIYHISPHLIVTDAELGNYAGFELLTFLRRRFPEVGVIALVREQVDRKEHLDKILADDVVTIAPLDLTVLGRSLIHACGKHPFRQENEKDDLGSPSAGGQYGPKVQAAP